MNSVVNLLQILLFGSIEMTKPGPMMPSSLKIFFPLFNLDISQFTLSSFIREFKKKPPKISLLLKATPKVFLNLTERSFHNQLLVLLFPSINFRKHYSTNFAGFDNQFQLLTSRRVEMISSFATLAAMTVWTYFFTYLLVSQLYTRGKHLKFTPNQWKMFFSSRAWDQKVYWLLRWLTSYLMQVFIPQQTVLRVFHYCRLMGLTSPPGTIWVTLSSKYSGRRLDFEYSQSGLRGRYQTSPSTQISFLSPFIPQISLASYSVALSRIPLPILVYLSSYLSQLATLLSRTSSHSSGSGAFARATTPCHSIKQVKGTPIMSLALQLSMMK